MYVSLCNDVRTVYDTWVWSNTILCHFVMVDALVTQPFRTRQCHIYLSLGLEKVQTWYSLLME